MSSEVDKTPGINKILAENIERLKELAAINQTTGIIKEGKSIEDTLQQICFILPRAWQYPEFTVARIIFDGQEYLSSGFRLSQWTMTQEFMSIDNRSGRIEICYVKKFPTIDEGPFLKEERHLVENLAHIIVGYINSETGKQLLSRVKEDIDDTKKEIVGPYVPVTNRKLLQNFLNKNNADRDIYHDLMPFKVKEILLVANLYDAYCIEREGKFSEQILGEYHQLNLTSMPRVTGVSTLEETMEQLHTKHFDMIILMVGVDKNTPIEYSERIKKEFPYISIFLLLNNDADIALFEEQRTELTGVDKIFVWNGESQVFFAMIKSLEDKVNVDNDTKIGLSRVILLVEDSAKYYSRYMPMLYQSVLAQTQRIIDDVSTDAQYKILRLRARPKILLASNYEEAMNIYHKFREFLLCLISDVKFKKEGVFEEDAGIQLVKEIKGVYPNLPVILQSSDVTNAAFAFKLKCSFINKNSETLRHDIRLFIRQFLGFGDFVYKDADGNEIATAKSLKEFEEYLYHIPAESLVYHANKNHFSLWLMARGEIRIAKMIAPYNISDFKSAEDVRDYLINVIQNYRNEKNKGKVVEFNTDHILNAHNIVTLSTGSLGGKGRGLAFINSMLFNLDLSRYVKDINIKAPMTAVIGVDEYESFLDRNNLLDKTKEIYDFKEVQQLFLVSDLTIRLVQKIRILLMNFDQPLAIRSSGLFEDSLLQPVAGVFQTYLVPNNHPDLNQRVKQVTDAIKLVYASIFSEESRANVNALNYKIEEEKMAVVIQEVVGNRYKDAFYPHISGVAQSYNYYPFGHMKPEEGYAVIAVGLGKYVVDGEKAFRFSPVFPTIENNSPKDQFKNSQVEFYAVDLKKQDIDLMEGETAGLIRLDIDDAEEHGNLMHCASVYNSVNDTISPGLDAYGPRIINFANILKYDYIPLAKTIEMVLDIVKEAMGSPIEIEFAVDLSKDKDGKASFYLLQIKPLIGNVDDYNVKLEEVDRNKLLLLSEMSMGNGLVDDVVDVIYISPDQFHKDMTLDIASVISSVNEKMRYQNKNYILIGPGRWGTRDRWIGIPVKWNDISSAKLIVETSFEDYPLEASSGSHFFHNVTSMNIGYCSIHHHSETSFVDYDLLRKQDLVAEYGAVKHIRFKKPLTIKMDGKKRLAIANWNS
ncbi:PEP/pyruvate-binding domain-containing protein [Marinifilum sp. N1E240]|uniref:PEP/pyruvate-binding domain-containing protein n=1 Tax=Marinifilum sp. N1E240 TaxID=2608082 RepID=UPI001D048620|nr:PEP/pyruvate-binding domain-containing protein [Marinifilum sp. N1E240]